MEDGHTRAHVQIHTTSDLLKCNVWQMSGSLADGLGQGGVLWSGQERSKRKMVEAAVIESLPNMNSKRGDYILAPILARILWAEQIQ